MDLVRVLWAIFKYALVMAAVVVLVRSVGVWLDIADFPLLVTCVLTGVAAYITLMLWNKPPVVRDIAALLPLHRVPIFQRLVVRALRRICRWLSRVSGKSREYLVFIHHPLGVIFHRILNREILKLSTKSNSIR
jgi:hypothetical protein